MSAVDTELVVVVDVDLHREIPCGRRDVETHPATHRLTWHCRGCPSAETVHECEPHLTETLVYIEWGGAVCRACRTVVSRDDVKVSPL